MPDQSLTSVTPRVLQVVLAVAMAATAVAVLQAIIQPAQAAAAASSLADLIPAGPLGQRPLATAVPLGSAWIVPGGEGEPGRLYLVLQDSTGTPRWVQIGVTG